MNLSGKWMLIGSDNQTENCTNEKGVLTLTQNNDIWVVRVDQSDSDVPLLGVGFECNGLLCIARGIVTNVAELDGSVGLIQYNLNTPGQLPARWYHPSLKGKISKGISMEGPLNTLVGEYLANYKSAEGSAFLPLRKTITETGSHYQFSWWDSDKFHYVGVGIAIGDSLYAAWGAPGSIIQFAYYDLQDSGSPIRGNWVDYGRNKQGSEYLLSI